MNRETWLLEATDLLSSSFFDRPTLKLPSKLAVSCGIPKGKSAAIGQCWDPKVASDGTTHIFICPSLDEPFTVLSTLLHELCHAVVGVHNGHNAEFGRIARAVGLKGKLTSTHVDRESESGETLIDIAEKLGTYPHKAINKNTNKKKKQPTDKKVKLVSIKDDEYNLTISEAVLSKGYPTDPWGETMELLTK